MIKIERKGQAMNNIRVMIVDDDENISELLRLYLEKDGYTVMIAENGEVALKEFDSRMPGFIRQGKFIGVESCVSSPVRFMRDRETRQSSVKNLYLSGEGCGAAGGIISAACDGICCAESMLNN
jgi:ActR/RegA family two-component response regulator